MAHPADAEKGHEEPQTDLPEAETVVLADDESSPAEAE